MTQRVSGEAGGGLRESTSQRGEAGLLHPFPGKKRSPREGACYFRKWFLGQREPSKFGGLIEDFLYVKHQRQKCNAVCVLTQDRLLHSRGQCDQCLAPGTLMLPGMMTELGGEGRPNAKKGWLGDSTLNLHQRIQRWREGSVVKITGRASSGSRFNSQHPYCGSQSSITAPGDLVPSSGLCRNCMHLVYRKHPHTLN